MKLFELVCTHFLGGHKWRTLKGDLTKRCARCGIERAINKRKKEA